MTIQFETINKKHLCGDYPFGPNVKSALFGELVKIAQPVIELYQGDLFHDAIWIEKYITGPRNFYWGCDHAGTVLIAGDDVTPTNRDFALGTRKNVFSVHLIFEQNPYAKEVTGQWFVTITQIAGEIS
jgi:hypothetical protein